MINNATHRRRQNAQVLAFPPQQRQAPRRRSSLTGLLLTAAAALTLLLLAANAHAAPSTQPAPPMEFDQGASDKQAMFLRTYLRTRFCLVDSARNAMRMGARDRMLVMQMGAAACGGPLRSLLLRDRAMDAPHADRFIRALSDRAVEDVLDGSNLF